ncbi:MAG: CRTAC1 family protein, partial [Sphingomonadaceae bacterium]|nr:CRTAC1 family protein [Sphingomonadaceae bacterium]
VLPGVPGQTLTMLVSDFDGDAILDLFKGDDLAGTDETLLFGPHGTLRETSVQDQPMPYHTQTSMSYDQGDWNNDLIDDFYGAQIATSLDGPGRVVPQGRNRNLHLICQQFGADIGWTADQINACARELLSIDAIRNGKAFDPFSSCQDPWQRRDRALCAAFSFTMNLEDKHRNPDGDRARYAACRRGLAHIPEIQHYCRSLLTPTMGRIRRQEIEATHRPTLGNGNILMTGRADGSFRDMGSAAGVRAPGWSWNSRFADLDQDGRQDLLVATGMWLNAAASMTNVFYHNDGEGFSDATEAFGFTDIVPSYSYVMFDYDRDGDIDIVRDNASMRMIVHRNDRPAGRALWVNLRDGIGNRLGIGARVYVCTDGETRVRPGRCQMRVIKASGGYMSSDPVAAHFGLGDAREVSLIQIRWPDGEVSRVRPAGLSHGEIVVTRR